MTVWDQQTNRERDQKDMIMNYDIDNIQTSGGQIDTNKNEVVDMCPLHPTACFQNKFNWNL